MSGWPLVPLGELFDISRGGSPRPIDAFLTDDPGGVNWIMIGDAPEGAKYITGTRKRIRREGVSRSRVVKPGDFLLTNSMSFGRPYIMQAHGCIHDGWLALTPRLPSIDADFFFHLLGSKRVYAEFARLAAGATVKNLNIDLVRSVSIPVPPLPEQRRIAEILDQADALRAKRRAALGALDSLLESAFLARFGDPVSNPRGWLRKPIGEIGRVVTGNTPSRAVSHYYGDEIEWIKSDNINTPDYYLTRASESLSSSGRRVGRTAPPGSILVTCIAGSPECIGNAAMADREVAFNQQINALIPANGDPHFLYVQLLVGKKLLQLAATSGMKGMVSKSRFEQIELVFPPVPLQQEFGRRVLGLEVLRNQYRASLAALDSLFASLQHAASSGDL